MTEAERTEIRSPGSRSTEKASGGLGEVGEVGGEKQATATEIGRLEEFQTADGAEETKGAESARDCGLVLPEGSAGGRALEVGGGVETDAVGGYLGLGGRLGLGCG